MFLRIPDTVYTPYIAHTEADGYVLVHGHPLNGTILYTYILPSILYIYNLLLPCPRWS